MKLSEEIKEVSVVIEDTAIAMLRGNLSKVQAYDLLLRAAIAIKLQAASVKKLEEN